MSGIFNISEASDGNTRILTETEALRAKKKVEMGGDSEGVRAARPTMGNQEEIRQVLAFTDQRLDQRWHE